ncbi:CGRRF1 [Cervus elaphus hippelaphus]|uniref:Cell growth regulator with RING finger domain protein 1 n=1 Tax=Cervus elaphus hippelaphus TaxID=46360 RepID=A0A212CV27_CEREH|nr:CGRRF1 [Cervus elaphus hippelaphus]
MGSGRLQGDCWTVAVGEPVLKAPTGSGGKQGGHRIRITALHHRPIAVAAGIWGWCRIEISMVSVIHIPDKTYKLSCRILYQYLLLAQGQFHDLKQLFMSANNNSTPSSNSSPEEKNTDRSLLEKAGLSESEVEPPEENSKDCVVCQNGPVNWVLLPCRHTCLCDGCVKYFQQCPMCRQFVQESFALCSQKEQDKDKLKNPLGFGWDVPVILRNSEETQFNTRVFKKQMRQVKNPFGLEITNPSSASITTLLTLADKDDREIYDIVTLHPPPHNPTPPSGVRGEAL